MIVRWLIAQHVAGGGKDPSSDPFLMSRLAEVAEAAKKELSLQTSTKIAVPLLDGEKSLEVELTRRKFESLAAKLIGRMLKPVREVAIMSGVNLIGESGQAGIRDDEEDEESDEEEEGGEMSLAAMRREQLQGRRAAKERRRQRGAVMKEMRRLQKEYADPSIATFPGGRSLDDVILVGGATRMPCVQRLLRTVTGIEPKSSVNPDEAVSLGAAVLAGIMDGEIRGMDVMSAWQAAMYKAFYEQQLERERTNDDKIKRETSDEVEKPKADASKARDDEHRVTSPVVAEGKPASNKSSALRSLLRKRKSVPP